MIAISASRSVVSIYLDGAKYLLEDIPRGSGQGQIRRWPRSTSTAAAWTVSTRLTALEFEGGVTLQDVLTVLQRPSS